MLIDNYVYFYNHQRIQIKTGVAQRERSHTAENSIFSCRRSFLCCPYKLGQSSMYKGLDISCAGWNLVFINLSRLVCQECRDTFPVGCSLSSSSRVDIGNAEGMNYPTAILTL